MGQLLDTVENVNRCEQGHGAPKKENEYNGLQRHVVKGRKLPAFQDVVYRPSGNDASKHAPKDASTNKGNIFRREETQHYQPGWSPGCGVCLQ